ncbi:Hypothetical predicted protein [Marmota monax]|uniref:Protein S100-A12 n=1 Tax=Marmota monax TaxID=9995 RepID=A0A5E4A8X4_MARMO|nr:protein S100-A12 [Marmota monax]VTJ53161.1 Hypothetical predicted protein [Marmota monax]
MPTLEEHLEGIINIFHQHSAHVGDFDTLSKSELKKLITRDLANTIKVGAAHLVVTTCPPPALREWRVPGEDGGTRTGVGIPKIKLPLTEYSRIWMIIETERSTLGNSYYWWPLCWRRPTRTSTESSNLFESLFRSHVLRRVFSPSPQPCFA